MAIIVRCGLIGVCLLSVVKITCEELLSADGELFTAQHFCSALFSVSFLEGFGICISVFKLNWLSFAPY